MLVVRRLCLLTIIFTQRSSCIGRLQVEKCVSLLICSSTKCYIFHSSWCESVYGEMIYWSTNLLSHTLDNDFSSSCISKMNHSPRTCISVSTWNHPGWFELVHGKNIALFNNFNGWYNQARVYLANSMTEVINISCTIH